MPILDAEYLTAALLDAVEGGVRLGLTQIQSQAQKHAPVRDIFKHGHGTTSKASKSARAAVVMSMAAKWGAKGPPTAFSARSMNMRNFGLNDGGGLASHSGRLVQRSLWSDQSFVGKERVSGRANSLHPVIQSPAGTIGGRNFRSWAGPNVLEVGRIRKPSGGTFELASLLSSRGRYEAFGKADKETGARPGKGRAVRDAGSLEGQMIGGTLHDGITVDGPYRNGAEVYGYVQAVAHDPGRTHNYAKDQEFGSRHNKAQPFLRPGLRESKERILKIVDPTTGSQRGLLQRAMETGSRPAASMNDIGIPVRLVVELRLGGIRKAFWDSIGLGGT